MLRSESGIFDIAGNSVTIFLSLKHTNIDTINRRLVRFWSGSEFFIIGGKVTDSSYSGNVSLTNTRGGVTTINFSNEAEYLKNDNSQIMTLTLDGGNSLSLHSNGKLIDSIATTTSIDGPLNDISFEIGSNSGILLGSKIGEIIIYEGVLSQNDRSVVEGYLSQKWSIPLVD